MFFFKKIRKSCSNFSYFFLRKISPKKNRDICLMECNLTTQAQVLHSSQQRYYHCMPNTLSFSFCFFSSFQNLQWWFRTWLHKLPFSKLETIVASNPHWPIQVSKQPCQYLKWTVGYQIKEGRSKSGTSISRPKMFFRDSTALESKSSF